MCVLALHWKPLSCPTDHATGHTAHLRETSLLQELHGGETAVSAPADDDDFFRGVGILHDQVAGIPREKGGGNGSPTSFADFDHFGDLN